MTINNIFQPVRKSKVVNTKKTCNRSLLLGHFEIISTLACRATLYPHLVLCEKCTLKLKFRFTGGSLRL